MKHFLNSLRRLLRERRGSSMLEFALGSGLLVAACTATFQYGYIFYQYNTLKNAVGAGARWAAMAAYNSPNTTAASDFETKVKNMVVYGQPVAGNSPVLPRLTTSNVQLQVVFANEVPTVMKVSITGYTIDGIFGSMNCTNKPAVNYAYQGIWAPNQ